MKNIKFLAIALILCAGAFSFVSCSDLFENILNNDGTVKTGDDSLTPADSTNTDIENGLVVIKATDKIHNQIIYDKTQTVYFVGKVPDSFNDFEADYTSGNKKTLSGQDDPVEFRCFNNDENAKIEWKAVQIWSYVPEYVVHSRLDSNGNEVKYTGIASQKAEKLENPQTVLLTKVPSDAGSFVKSDLPYGVTVVTCKITADDEQYHTEYKIVLTKEYICTWATAETESSNVTDHGLVVIKQTAPDKNAIVYSSTTYEYTVGDITGNNKTEDDLTDLDDPVIFKCFLLDENADLSWHAYQTKTFEVEYDDENKVIVKQTLKDLDEAKEFGLLSYGEEIPEDPENNGKSYLQFVNENSVSEIKSNLPYGITEVYATISAQNEDENGELIECITEYKITLTKRHVITTKSKSLVVLSNEDDYSFSRIVFKSETKDYSLIVTQKDNGTEGMKFRMFLEDREAELKWTLNQVKEFTPVYSYRDETDSLTGQTVNVKYLSGQNENEVFRTVSFNSTGDEINNEITSVIPYGVCELKAEISSVDEETNTYTITLVRNLYDGSSTEGTLTSLLQEMTVSITKEGEESEISLEPEFSPEITTYFLEVDEESDEISISAIAETLGADISDLTVNTKYGKVPAVSYMTSPLVGGTSRISFTVTDESTVERTYSIYVEKPEDGDTSLKYINFTPEESYENGIKAFTFDKNFKGASYTASSKYEMTLEASERIDVNELTFRTEPNKKRTKISYSISESETVLPESWENDASYTVTVGDEEKNTIVKYLWIKTESDAYYHKNFGTSGYESTKRKDTLYHKIKISKAGDTNPSLSELYVSVTYENTDDNGENKTENILSLPASNDKKVGYTVSDGKIGSDKITTFADVLTFKFRPLDKDKSVTYTAKNTKWITGENTSFTGYSATEKGTADEGSALTGPDSEGYYTLTIGELAGGQSSTKDLPCGETTVKICGLTYNFTKPDLDIVTYSVTAGNGTGSGVYKPWTEYIYLENTVQTLEMSLTTTQQNETIQLVSCQQTYGANGTSLEGEKQNPGVSLFHYNVSEGENVVKWKLYVGNSSETLENYTKTGSTLNTASTLIPEGTTTLQLVVKNNEGEYSETYTYYIIRASDSESRLSELKLQGLTPVGFSGNLGSDDTENNFVYSAKYYDSTSKTYKTEFPVDTGNLSLFAHSVSEDALITVTKTHSDKTNVPLSLSSITNEDYEWDSEEIITESVVKGKLNTGYTLNENDTGTVLFRINVKSKDESTERNYYVFVYVTADKTARLDSLKILQKGNNSDSELVYTILGNDFDPDVKEYTDLYASLNYVGDILIQAEKYSKAKFLDDSECGIWLFDEDGIAVSSIDADAFDGTMENLIMHYDYYINHLGETFQIVYKIQAQNENVLPVTYKVNFTIPDYQTVTEKTTVKFSSDYEYEIPDGKDYVLGYRFGSVFNDEGTAAFLKGKFGGIDIAGSCDAQNEDALWYESSFAASGLQFVLEYEGKKYGIDLNEHGVLVHFYEFDLNKKTVSLVSLENSPDIGFCVVPTFTYEDEKPYLELALNIDNPSGKDIKIGAVMDTLVGTVSESTNSRNDSVSVEETNNGFTLNGKDYYFALILKNAFNVDDVSNMWYGKYNNALFINNVFAEEAASSLSEGEDSALTFSWNLGTGENYTKTIRFTMGEVNN